MDENRPSKRQKVVTVESGKYAETATSTSKDANGYVFGSQSRRQHKEKSNSSRGCAPHAGGRRHMSTSSTQQRFKNNPKKTKTFSQASVLQTGDKGIFVTCDKGREKQSLLELLDLVEQFIEQQEQKQQQEHEQENEGESSDVVATTTATEQGSQEIRETNNRPTGDAEEEEKEVDVEASIMEELAALQGKNQQQRQAQHNGAPPPRDGPPDTSHKLSMPGKEAAAGSATTGLAVDLITLDVPCVSFLRLPGHSALDPVNLVHHICADAAADPTRPRSRYVKRLTPVTRLGKVLSRGLDTVCADVLPRFFEIYDSGSSTARSLTYAIRPSIRNNDKINRDQIIQTVGECVHTLGKGQHKVDLKGYEAGILVEVYKGWVGICVVGNGGDGKIVPIVSEMGYERLKRFNLSEIYASGRVREGVE